MPAGHTLGNRRSADGIRNEWVPSESHDERKQFFASPPAIDYYEVKVQVV
jgi:hypothetical protein